MRAGTVEVLIEEEERSYARTQGGEQVEQRDTRHERLR
jgi:hypothetical protein